MSELHGSKLCNHFMSSVSWCPPRNPVCFRCTFSDSSEAFPVINSGTFTMEMKPEYFTKCNWLVNDTTSYSCERVFVFFSNIDHSRCQFESFSSLELTSSNVTSRAFPGRLTWLCMRWCVYASKADEVSNSSVLVPCFGAQLKYVEAFLQNLVYCLEATDCVLANYLW